MTIGSIALGLLGKLLLYDLLLNGFHQGRDNGSMEFRRAFFQSLNQPIDCQSRIWYLKYQAKVHRDLAQRIPPFFGYGNPFIKVESVSFFKKRINHSTTSIT